MTGQNRTTRDSQRVTHRRMLVLALVPILVLATFAPAQASQRVESKAYNGSVFNDCGRTSIEGSGAGRTEVCFDIQSGDKTLDLIVTDESGLPVAALVYFNDDNSNIVDSRGYAEHLMCGRGDWGGTQFGPLLDPENPRTPLVGYEPLFEVPRGATKVLVYLGDSNWKWDAYPITMCLLMGRPSHWGSTGTIEAIFHDGE